MCFSLQSVFTDRCVQRICCMFDFSCCVMKIALFCMYVMLKEIFISFYEFVPAAQNIQLSTSYIVLLVSFATLGSVLTIK